jgi:hypothetical protein
VPTVDTRETELGGLDQSIIHFAFVVFVMHMFCVFCGIFFHHEVVGWVPSIAMPGKVSP